MTSALTTLSIILATSLPVGDSTQTLSVDGSQRSYLLHVPKSDAANKPMPVVLIFHGGGSNAKQMQRYCNLNAKADQAGFIAVYPRGTGRFKNVLTFNGGNCCGAAMRNKADDVAFVGALLDDLERRGNIDTKRIFATGISNGAIMCYRLADEMSARIAAIAPVAGPMGKATCAPKQPVSVIHFHGTSDEFVNYAGGAGKRSISQTNFFSVAHSVKAWTTANGCNAQPSVTQLPDTADDNMRVTRKRYANGKQGSEVVLYEIEGGGHTWPGRTPRFRRLGPSTKDISANDLMWEFFQQHGR